MDCRAIIKIHFSIYGHTVDQEWNINYIPEDDEDDLDSRIRKWFREQYAIARAGYERDMARADATEKLRQHERAERAELKRLQAKYGKDG